jgi:hypothetical protein
VRNPASRALQERRPRALLPEARATLAAAGAARDAVDAVRGGLPCVTIAYREVGEGVPPLALLQHFRGNLDSWDPALIAGRARVTVGRLRQGSRRGRMAAPVWPGRPSTQTRQPD